ncbi:MULTISPECIES: efflux RND transporter periplasmic adaptor subunit [unclassified Moraxella]|uniref:efflux RND transporter periplasmic adaptor subunit n=1 Tax=unclassified Moraxella TaxID=2685852 RepID=UPI003AF5FA2B
MKLTLYSTANDRTSDMDFCADTTSPCAMLTNKATPSLRPMRLLICAIGSILWLTACQQKPDNASNSNASNTAKSSQSASASATAPLANDEIQLLASDVMTAKAERYQPKVPVTGTLQVVNQTTVQATVNAQVKQVLVKIGERVTKGQPLVLLDIQDSQNQLAQAQADLASTQAQAVISKKLASKNKILLDQGFVSQIEYERSVAEATAQQEAIKAKQAQVNIAKKMFGDTTITAPSTGIVNARSVEVGQMVNPNQPLMEIVDPNSLQFVANVPSEAQTQLRVGQSVPFTVGNNPTQFVGQISRIAPQVDPVTRQLAMYVDVTPNQNNSQLKSGMFATGQLNYGQIQVGVLVPMSAVTLDSTTSPASSITATNPASPKIDAPSRQMDASQTLPSAKVWVIGADHRLRQMPVQVVHRYDDSSQYLLTGIEQGTVVVVTNLNEQDANKKVVLK